MPIADPILLNLPTFIETPRLILRPPRARDGEGIYKALKDGYEGFVKWLNFPAVFPYTVEGLEKEARIHHAEWITRTYMRFLVIHKETNIIIGRFGYPPFQLNWYVPFYGISYLLSESWQGQGYATEGINALVRYAFEHMQARKVEIKCDAENPKSIAIPERLGFEHEATLKGYWPGKDKDKLSDVLSYCCFDMSRLPSLDIKWA